jgi:hypothetical protein
MSWTRSVATNWKRDEQAAKTLAVSVGAGFGKAESHRLKGELLLLGDNDAASEAAQCFRDAIEVARRQGAKSWELRATTRRTRCSPRSTTGALRGVFFVL